MMHFIVHLCPMVVLKLECVSSFLLPIYITFVGFLSFAFVSGLILSRVFVPDLILRLKKAISCTYVHLNVAINV